MSDFDIPDGDHVVRYASPRLVRKNGKVDARELFSLRTGETGLSVNWLEWFGELTKSEQLDEVRRRIRLRLRRRGRFVELNVGTAKDRLRRNDIDIRIVHRPSAADPSHSQILGLPQEDSADAAKASDLFEQCILELHPAIL